MNSMLENSAIPSTSGSASKSVPSCWQPEFLKMLPAIERDVRLAFRELQGDHRDEAVQEAICHCCHAYVRLCQQGRAAVANSTTLARYAVAHYRVGGRMSHSMNVKDVMTPNCQYTTGVRVESMTSGRRPYADWQEMLVENRHVTPADLAASRIDYPAWLSSLGAFRRRIAETLATGEGTKRVARQFCLSASRISQLRGEFRAAWEAFHAPKTTAESPRWGK